MPKQLIEETEELCGMCGGLGTRLNFEGSKPGKTEKRTETCPRCAGTKYVVTKRITRYGEVHQCSAADSG